MSQYVLKYQVPDKCNKKFITLLEGNIVGISNNFLSMMTSPNGHIFHVTNPLCGEFTGPGEFPTQRPVTRSFDVFFDWGVWINGWVNNREAGDLRHHRGHYDVNVMDNMTELFNG